MNGKNLHILFKYHLISKRCPLRHPTHLLIMPCFSLLKMEFSMGTFLRSSDTWKECGDSSHSYYSSHFCYYGLNVQASLWCQYALHILLYYCPGKSPYQDTLEKLSLHSIISQLPLGLCIIGYAAYTDSDQCLHHSQDPAVSTLAKMHIATSWVRCKYELRHHWAY